MQVSSVCTLLCYIKSSRTPRHVLESVAKIKVPVLHSQQLTTAAPVLTSTVVGSRQAHNIADYNRGYH